MPEGHTLFALARDLHEAFAGSSPEVSSPQGKFTLQILGAVAEFERSLIRERTKAGVRAAKSPRYAPSIPGRLPSPGSNAAPAPAAASRPKLFRDPAGSCAIPGP